MIPAHPVARCRYDPVVFAAVALLGLVVVALRSVLVPFVHDEARAFFLYIQRGDVLPYLAEWDAANHVLVSLAASALHEVFGPAPWVLRAFSVACYALYAFYVWRAGRWFCVPLIRWCMWVTLLFTPFAFDFFGLFRGYGPSLAFLLMALVHVAEFTRKPTTKSLVWAMVALAAGVLANLSLLVLMLIAIGWCGMVVLKEGAAGHRLRFVLVALVLALPPLLFQSAHALELADRGLLYHGSERGLLLGTAASLLVFVIGSSDAIVRWTLVGSMVFAGAMAARTAVGRGRTMGMGDPLVMVMTLFLAELVGRVFLYHVVGVLYPLDRAALHLLLLALLVLGMALDRASMERAQVRWLGLLLLLLPMRTALGTSLYNTTMWAEQSVHRPLFEGVMTRQDEASRPLLIGTTQFTDHTLAYEAWWRGFVLQPAQNELPPGQQELVIADKGSVLPGYHLSEVRAPGRLALYERERSDHTMILLDTLLRLDGQRIFINLWSGDRGAYAGEPLLFDVEAWFSGPEPYPRADLVLEMKKPDEQHALFDRAHLDRMVSYHQERKVRLLRYLPSDGSGQLRRGVFIWDYTDAGLVVDSCRLRISRAM